MIYLIESWGKFPSQKFRVLKLETFNLWELFPLLDFKGRACPDVEAYEYDVKGMMIDDILDVWAICLIYRGFYFYSGSLGCSNRGDF